MENGRDGGQQRNGNTNDRIFHLNWKTGSGRNQTQVHSITETRSLEIQNRKHSPRVCTCLRAWLSERTRTGKIVNAAMCVCIYQHFIDIICREVSMSMMLHSYFFSHFGIVSFSRCLYACLTVTVAATAATVFYEWCCWCYSQSTALKLRSFDNWTSPEKQLLLTAAKWISVHETQ